jgi:hypothetical protein
VLVTLCPMTTLWLGPASAATTTQEAATTSAVSALAVGTSAATTQIFWAWTVTPQGPTTPVDPPTTVPPTTVPPTTVPPTTVPPVQSGINSVDRILFSMNGPHEGAPHGVPTYWSWAQHPDLGAVTPPAGMSSITGWGQIYADASNAHPANVRVELRNMETYVWSKSNHAWTRVQADPHVDGGHFVEDFAGNSAIPTDLRAEPDGGNSTGMVSGYNFHFWPAAGRGTLPNPSDIGAVYTTVQARLILDNPAGPDNRSQARYLANMGGDWWRTTTAPFGDGTNNPAIGEGRFTYLTPNWTAIDFYTGGPVVSAPNSWTETQLLNSPPPINVM